MEISIQSLVGKRCLLKLPGIWRGHDSVDEYRILEVAPSGNWTKLMNLNGNKFWKATSEISFVEELRDLKAERAKEELK